MLYDNICKTISKLTNLFSSWDLFWKESIKHFDMCENLMNKKILNTNYAFRQHSTLFRINSLQRKCEMFYVKFLQGKNSKKEKKWNRP